MFQTKKGKLVALAVLIIILLAALLCAFVLLTNRNAPDSSKSKKNPEVSSSGTIPDDIPGSFVGEGDPSAPSVGNASGDVPDRSVGKDAPAIPSPDASSDNAPDNFADGISQDTASGNDPDSSANGTSQEDASGNGNPSDNSANGTSQDNISGNPPDGSASGTSPDITSGGSQDASANVTTPTNPSGEAAQPTPAAPSPTPQSTPALQPTPTPSAGATKAPTPTPSPTKAPTPTPSPSPTKAPTPTHAPAAPTAGADGSVSANGQLQVIGTQLSNADGSPIVLRGVSTHGIAWFPDFATKPFMRTLKEEWGATVFRIAMYSYEGSDSYVNNPSWNKTKVCSLIDAAIDLDMYVIVDWHILADGNPQTYQKQAAEFFTYIASTYPGVPNILYEICNEPNGGASWRGNIKPYANEMIPLIRQYSPDAVVLVGTPTWSQDVDAAAADPLSFDNVMYALHFYAGTHKEWLRSKADTALGQGLALFATEWGTTDASGNGAVDKTSSDEWLAYLEKNQISWCNWSLCNKSESSALLLASAPSTGAMPDSALSESGKYIKKKMLEYSGTTPVEQKPQDSADTSGQKATPTPSPAPAEKDSGTSDTKSTSGQNPSVSTNTGLTLLYYNENREDSTNTISPRFQIKNNTGNDISLDQLTILYYYTPEKDITQCFFCDYADVNGSSYRAITSDVNATFSAGGNSGSCMKITFSSGAGILAAGDTATLQVRITNEDWSNYIQSNDASFSPDATSYTENNHAALISK